MDIGGTYVKCALVTPQKQFLAPAWRLPVDSRGNAFEILVTFCDAVARGAAAAESHGGVLRRICVAMCGPLDYEKGVSLMREDKYRSIYKVNLKHEFHRAWPEGAEADITFIHDVQAFLLGMASLDPALQAGRVMAVTLGTGIGSAFMADGKIIPPGCGVPEKGLGRLPYRAGKVENYIGGPALVELYRKAQTAHRDDSPHLSENKLVNKVKRVIPSGPGMDHDDDGGDIQSLSVREIAARARSGDLAAPKVFFTLGDMLGEALAPLLRDFKPDHLVFGGQVSRAFDLLRAPLLARISGLIPESGIVIAENLETNALLGAVVAAELGMAPRVRLVR